MAKLTKMNEVQVPRLNGRMARSGPDHRKSSLIGGKEV